MSKLLYAVDLEEYPGKVHVRYVEFSEELITREEFDYRSFELVDLNRPEVRQFVASQLKQIR